MIDADEIDEISVWEDLDQDAAIQAVTELHGPSAVTAAAYCALTARFDCHFPVLVAGVAPHKWKVVSVD